MVTVGRNTHGWRYQDGFEEWLSEYAKKEVLKRKGKWYLIAEKYTEAGSFQHLNMLMHIAKEFVDGKSNEQPNIGFIHYLLESAKKQKEAKERGESAGINLIE